MEFQGLHTALKTITGSLQQARAEWGFLVKEAEALLRKDVLWAEGAVLCLIGVPLRDGQFDGLVSFAFNCGSGALQRSTLRRKVNREEQGVRNSRG